MADKEAAPMQQLPEQPNMQKWVQLFTPERSIVAASRVAIGAQTEFDPPIVRPDGIIVSHIIPGSD